MLTFKADGAGKGRIAVRGCQHESLGGFRTESPTASRRCKHLFYLKCVQEKWLCEKGDVRCAFLQGDLQKESGHSRIFAEPVPELAAAMHLPADHCAELLRCVYGLVDAPRAWHTRIKRDLAAIGWRVNSTEPSSWSLFDRHWRLCGLCCAHGDDFLIAGDRKSQTFLDSLDHAKQLYDWSEWESKDFLQTGTHVVQHQDFSFTLDQSHYCDTVTAIPLGRDRRSNMEKPLSKEELSQCRSVIGALLWYATQTRSSHSP